MRWPLLLLALWAPALCLQAIPLSEQGPGGILIPDLASGPEGLTAALARDPLPAPDTYKVGVAWEGEPFTWSWFWARDEADTYQRYGVSLRYVPFIRHARVTKALILTPYWWSTTAEAVGSTQFGFTAQYLVDTGKVSFTFGGGYQQDNSVPGENAEFEVLAALATPLAPGQPRRSRQGGGRVRAEWRGGGDNFTPRQMAFSYERPVGSMTLWAGWRAATPPGGEREESLFAGLGISVPWLNP